MMSSVESNLKRSSDLITLLRFPLKVDVVCIHQFGTPMWSIFAVPCFFMISGYLFFYNLRGFGLADYKKKIIKRVRSLLVPHILWCTLYLLLFCAKNSENLHVFLKQKGWLHIYYDCNVWNGGANLYAFSSTAYFPILGVTWYIRDLIICALLSPAVYWLTKKIGLYWLGLLLVMWVLRPMELNLHGITIGSLLFFSSGAYFSLRGKELLKPSHICGVSAAVLSIALVGLDFAFELNRSLKCLYIVFCMLSVFYFGWQYLMKGGKRMPGILVESSFIIFISHQFYLGIYTSVCRNILSGAFPFVLPLVMSLAMTVLTGFLLFLLLRKCAPKMLKSLCGGR